MKSTETYLQIVQTQHQIMPLYTAVPQNKMVDLFYMQKFKLLYWDQYTPGLASIRCQIQKHHIYTNKHNKQTQTRRMTSDTGLGEQSSFLIIFNNMMFTRKEYQA